MELLRAATLCVSDLERTKELYRRYLDYETAEDGIISTALAQSWGTPRCAGLPFSVLRPVSQANVFLRFIQQPAIADYRPLRSYGWSAIEICTQDTLAVYDRLKASPFEIIGPPKALDGMPSIFPMQVKGPDQEIVYLTQIGDSPNTQSLPRAKSLVDKLFILVMACRDIKKTALWFDKHLGVNPHQDMEIIYTMINDAFDLPDTTKHKITTLGHEHNLFLEIDAYPENTSERPRHDSMLPPAAAIGSLIHPDFPKLDLINHQYWISPPQNHEGVIYGGKPSACLLDPDGTLIEVIEA